MPIIGSARNFSTAAIFFMALFASLFGATRQAKAGWPKSVTLKTLNASWSSSDPYYYYSLVNPKRTASFNVSNLKLEKTSVPVGDRRYYDVLYIGKLTGNFFNYRLDALQVVNYNDKGFPMYGSYQEMHYGKEATVYLTIRTYDTLDDKKITIPQRYSIYVDLKYYGQTISGYPSGVQELSGSSYINEINIPKVNYSGDTQYNDTYDIKSNPVFEGIDGNAGGKIVFDDDFHVENMPVIMRNIGAKTKNNAWNMAATYWDKWLKGTPSTYKYPLYSYPFDWSSENVYLPLSWIESTDASKDNKNKPSPRVADAIKAFQDPKSKSFYVKSLSAIIQNLERDYNISKAKDGSKFPLCKTNLRDGMYVTESIFSDFAQRSPVVSNIVSTKSPYLALNVDPLAALLNNFNFYMIPIGDATVRKGVIYINIKQIAYFAVDGFEFTDWEKLDDKKLVPSEIIGTTDYKFWGLPDKTDPTYSLELYHVYNRTFRDYRRHNKLGMDYLVVSDLKIQKANYSIIPMPYPQAFAAYG